MWIEFPRYVGFPSQVYVRSIQAFNNLFKILNGKAPIFVSVSRFPPNQCLLDCIMIDLDTAPTRLTNAFKDVKKLTEFFRKKDMEYAVVFSGRKGFHFYLPVQPVEVEEVGTKSKLDKDNVRNVVYSIQYCLIKQLSLYTVDHKLTGRVGHLVRFPTSMYVSEDGKPNGRYCRVIENIEDVKTVKEVIDQASTPGTIPKFKHENTIENIEHAIPDYRRVVKYRYPGDDTVVRAAMAEPTLDLLPPCLKVHIVKTEPSHTVRFESTAYLKFLGFNDFSILSFYRCLDWRDFDSDYSLLQILSIKPRLPQCKLLSVYLGKEYCKRCFLWKE